MNIKFAGLFYFILAGLFITVYSQESIVSFNKSAEMKGNNSLSDLPFQVGLEFGPAIPLKEKKYFYHGWWIYSHINLYDKRIYLRAAFGNLKLNNDLGGTAPYLQLGITFLPLKIKQHSLSVNLGLCFFAVNKRAGIVSVFVGLNYLYRLNKYVSLSAGIQMPAIREARYDEYYHNPFATIGVVFF
ncbi:MAG: hypothetical protein J0M37_08775 [Ignavibacteria bacterium]|nr:hypothetical protein [Ignavibacteria bacterium]